jgi:energy-converting hydrogenase A subunit M
LVIGKKVIIQQEEKLVNKTNIVNSWVTKLEIMVKNCNNKDIKKRLTNLYETVRYMDPVENENTKELDIQVNYLIEKLSNNLDMKLIDDLNKKINERKIIISSNK